VKSDSDIISVQQLKPDHGSWMVTFWKGLKKTRTLQIMILPGLVYYIIFHYLPMYGVVIAFKDFKPLLGILGSPWIGFKQFNRFFSHPYFFRLIKNTFLLSFYSLIFGFPAPIILALMLNEVRNATYKRFVQTVSYLPHFISIVAVVSILNLFLSPTSGYINVILKQVFGIKPIYFMVEPGWFRPLFVGSGIWQNIGWGAILYLAALSQVDMQLYDAALVDGASRLQRIWHISLPSIMPTIVILLILRIGTLFYVGFEKVILMYNPAIYTTADVIGSYVYRRGLQHAEFSYGAAVGLFNSVINVTLLITANWVSRRVTEQSLW
jgi:putative aldouronate transport system permease protein